MPEFKAKNFGFYLYFMGFRCERWDWGSEGIWAERPI